MRKPAVRSRTAVLRRFGIALVVLATLATSARAQYLFGQNKVIYTPRNWKVIATPRLDIYYYVGEEELAAYVADFAEKTCGEYETYFDHVFEQKIPLILYASHHDFKQTNVIDMMISDYVGGFTEYLRGRVAIPHTGSMTQLRNVMRHELVHAFMNDKLAHIMHDHKRFNQAPPPLWFSEGLAEYVALRKPDTEARMFIRDLVVNDNLVEMRELWRINGTFLMYKEGESLLGYMATRFGDEALVRILDNWWQSDRFEVVLHRTLGIGVDELNRDWKRYLKRRYYPAVAVAEWPEQHGMALTHGPGIHTRPVPYAASADSSGHSDVVFLASGAGSIDLMRAHIEPQLDSLPGQPPVRLETLVRGGRNSNYESFPAFASGPEIHGSRVAFTVKSGEGDALVLYDLEKRREVKRLRFDSLIGISTPTWSPDGEEIVFSGVARSGWPDLYRVRLATGELEQLTHDVADDRDPDWSHDGTRIAWSSDRAAPNENGVYNIWVLDLATGDATPLTTGLQEDTAPSWGPDDRRLLFGSDADGRNNIYLYDLESREVSQVSFALGGMFTPQWTPNGEGFLACVFDNTSYNIFRFQLDRQREAPAREEIAPRVAMATPVAGVGVGTDARVDWGAPAPIERYPTRAYRPKFGLDFIRTAISYDPNFVSAVGGQLGFTDMLGNHRVGLLFANGADSFDQFFKFLDLGLTYTNESRRLHWTVGAFHLTSTYDPRLDRYRYERRYGGLFGVAYPLSRYQRIETTFVGRVADMEREDAAILGVGQHALLFSNFTSFVHDNTLWSWTGPADGSRLNVTIGHTIDASGANRGGSSVQLDARRYQPLGGRVVFAARSAARGSWGPDLQYFYLGGPFDLRGYQFRSLFARRTMLLNGELRFPLLDRLLIGLPFQQLEFGGFRGALFSDAAYLGFPYQAWLGSLGVGFEMWLGPGFVARLDVGRTHDFNRFSRDTFTHFFLGWDY
jgi:Omp85 superfamily domain/WD40-like Beta Propeller Repeat